MFELFREAGLYDKLGQVDIGALIDSVARVFEIEGLRGGSLEVTHGSNLRYIDLNGLDSSYDSEEGTCWGVFRSRLKEKQVCALMAVTHSFSILDELESMDIGEEDERGDIGKGLDMTGSAELSSVCSIALCLLYHVVLSLCGGGGGGWW